MAKNLRLTIKTPETTADVQLESAASSLEICYQDDDFYLVQGEQDPLGFLFAGKNNSLRGQQIKVAKRKDPLSILNDHFQPPTEKVMSTPIMLAVADDIVNEADDFYSEGNILKDLGFLGQDELKYPMQSNLNCLLPYLPEKLGYK